MGPWMSPRPWSAKRLVPTSPPSESPNISPEADPEEEQIREDPVAEVLERNDLGMASLHEAGLEAEEAGLHQEDQEGGHENEQATGVHRRSNRPLAWLP